MLVWRYSKVLRLLVLPAYCSILLYTVDQCSTVQNDSGSGQNALTNRWSRRSYDLRLRWLLSEPYSKQALRILHISKNANAYTWMFGCLNPTCPRPSPPRCSRSRRSLLPATRPRRPARSHPHRPSCLESRLLTRLVPPFAAACPSACYDHCRGLCRQ